MSGSAKTKTAIKPGKRYAPSLFCPYPAGENPDVANPDGSTNCGKDKPGDDRRSIEITLALYASGTCSLFTGVFSFLALDRITGNTGQNIAMVATLTL